MAKVRTVKTSFDTLSARRGSLTPSDLAGLELTLEYTDVYDQRTTRTVRILRWEGDSLLCHCYMRRDQRSFRFDRINAVIDGDGVVKSAAEFFGLFGVPFRSYTPAASPSGPVKPSAGFAAMTATEAAITNSKINAPRRHGKASMWLWLLVAVLLTITLIF